MTTTRYDLLTVFYTNTFFFFYTKDYCNIRFMLILIVKIEINWRHSVAGLVM